MSQRDQKNGDSHPARPFTPLNNVTLQDTRWFAVFPTPAEGIYCGFWITRDGNWPVGTAHTPKALRLCIWNFRSRIGPRRRWRCDRRLRSGRGGECSDGLRLQNPAQAETPFSMATQILLGAISGPLHILVCLPYLVLLPFSCTLVGLPPLLAELLLLQVEVGLRVHRRCGSEHQRTCKNNSFHSLSPFEAFKLPNKFKALNYIPRHTPENPRYKFFGRSIGIVSLSPISTTSS